MRSLERGITLVVTGMLLIFSRPISAQVPQGAALDSPSAALQYLMQVHPNAGWQPNGLMIAEDGGPTLVPYNKLEVTVNHYLPFGMGPQQLFVGTRGLGAMGIRLYTGSYDQNKQLWDKAIIALKILGVPAATPSGADRDIRGVQPPPTAATKPQPPARTSQRPSMQQPAPRQASEQPPMTAEEKELVAPIIAYYERKSMPVAMTAIRCSESYRYVGGKVIDRSVDGKVGVFLLAIRAINIDNSPIIARSILGELCGDPPRDMRPSETFEFSVKAMYRKYDSGWRLEQVLR